MDRRVYLEQLGCPKNEVDGEHMLGALARAGFRRVDSPEQSDVLLVNTCGFITPAKEESIGRILELARYKNGSARRLLVAGCLAQRYPRQLLSDIPEIDALVGVDRIEDIVLAARGDIAGNCYVSRPDQEYREPDAPRERARRPWAYLKISDGCDNACAFCAIPQFRGRNRSREFEEIVSEAQSLAAAGVAELIVVAQDTTSYGVDRYGRRRLGELLVRVAECPGIAWVRLMYAFPRFVDDELIEVLTTAPGVARYLDMPIQHIDDNLLTRMNRGMGEHGTRSLLERIRRQGDGLALRTSVIVGHPGETSGAFGRLADFLADFEFDRLGVFLYSEEEGTRSTRMAPKVDEATALHRRRLLLDLQEDILARRQESQVGTRLFALAEDERDGALWGRSEADAPEVDCSVRFDTPVARGTVVPVHCVGTEGVDLVVRPDPGT